MSDGVPDPNAGLSDAPADSTEVSQQGGAQPSAATPGTTPSSGSKQPQLHGAQYSPMGGLPPAPVMVGSPEMMAIMSLTRGLGSANGR